MSEFNIDAFLKSPAAVDLRNRFAGRKVTFGQEWEGVPDDMRRAVADRLVADGVWRFETEVHDEQMERPYWEESGGVIYVEGWKTESIQEGEPDRTGRSYAWHEVEPAEGQRNAPQDSWTVCREVYSSEEARVYPSMLADQIGVAVLAQLGYGEGAPSLSKTEAAAVLAHARLFVDRRVRVKSASPDPEAVTPLIRIVVEYVLDGRRGLDWSWGSMGLTLEDRLNVALAHAGAAGFDLNGYTSDPVTFGGEPVTVKDF